MSYKKFGIFSAVLKRFISLEEINLSLAGTTSKLAAMVIMDHLLAFNARELYQTIV